jgi:hypothetical protein
MDKDENQTLSIVYIAYLLLLLFIVFTLDIYQSITLWEIVLFFLFPIFSFIFTFLNCKYLNKIWINPFLVYLTILLAFIIIKFSRIERDIPSFITYSIFFCFPSVLSSLLWISIYKLTTKKSKKINIALMVIYLLIYFIIYWLWHYVLNS